MNNKRVTAIVPTYNEAAVIERALASLHWVDELIVVDSFSTDDTVKRASRFTRRVLFHEYENSAAQKNWIIPQATYPWILLLDADEAVTPGLATEIQHLLEKGPQHDAYWIGRDNHFMGRRVRFSGWQNDAVIRLFHRDRCRYEAKHVHAEIIAEGSVGRLQGRLLHYTYKDLPTFLAKMDRYTTWGAQDRFERGVNADGFRLLAKPLFRFLRHYLLKQGFRDGWVGLVIALLSAHSVFLRTLKLMRLHAGESLHQASNTAPVRAPCLKETIP